MTAPSRRRRGRPPKNLLADTHPELADLLVDQSLRDTLSTGSSAKVLWRCPDHLDNPRHVYPAYVGNKTASKNPLRCNVCSGKHVVAGINDIATTHAEVAALMVDETLAVTRTASSNKTAEFHCGNPDHDPWTAPISRVTIQGSRCPQCAGRTAVVGVDDLATTHPELAAQLVDPRQATTLKAGSGKATWRCPVPGHPDWTATVYARTAHGAGCPACTATRTTATPAPAVDHTDVAARAQTNQGHHMAALTDVVRALLPNHALTRGDRATLPGHRELDIVIPTMNVAIEFNSMYWHSEAVIDDPAYHAEKSRLAADAGLRLIHVWEDDWAHKRDIVIRGLAHRLGATDRLPFAVPDIDPALAQTVYARTLHVKTVQGAEARAFWRDNHIQGPVGSPYYVGLRDDEDRLRALLGVGATNHGSRAAAAPGVWDIQRYATAGAVPGGFTRLLAHTTRLLKAHGEIVRTWTSFSNDDVSDGGMYVAAGFTVDKKQRPSYSYVGGRTGWRRAHRSRYTRSTFETRSDLVYEPGWTEREAARANGLLRIYDAGKTRWVKHL